ncbi:glucosaminidase domain-containing protein [Sulfurimonas sp. HSL-1716]|uniref:glucosaminidase domain-containing protein n=1 Tax=Hydrocurvibacter sulfurireducens TaxID=3131937 RepID=UPI0031F9ACD1
MKKIILLLTISVSLSSAAEFSYRKYPHVKKFYKELAPQAIKIAHEYHLPPAAVLAISGLESGYGRGYVSRITGNVMSLGAFKSDHELPSVFLPWCDTHEKILIDPKEIEKHPKEVLHYKKRDNSLKRDYRPAPFAGTCKDLEYFKYHPKERSKARYRCMEDFATRWISKTSNKKSFAKARIWLDALVKKNGEKILYEKRTNEQFIKMIGGHPDSFNYRKNWPKKALQIMRKAGLVELCRDMYIGKKSFIASWSKQQNSRRIQ